MPFSLYAATIPSYRQILSAVGGLLDKAETFCAEKAIPAGDIVQARLTDDMLPFAYQVKSVTVHSINAINSVHTGSFGPDMTPPPSSFEGLKAQLEATLAALQAIAPADMDALVGRDMVFALGERRLEFTAENFLLSFSQPNFYFHATTAYDILRSKGMAIGKRDFIGVPRIKATT